MTFTVTIDEDRAKEILESEDFCYKEGMGGDLSFLLVKIEKEFPDLWYEYHHFHLC